MFALGGTAVILLAPVSILGTPFLQKHSVFFSATLWLMVYLFLQLVLTAQESSRNIWYLLHAAVEVSFLLLLIGVAFKVSQWLRQLDRQVVMAAAIQAATDLPTLAQAKSVIHAEMTRSRHYERPLAIIAFQINNPQTDEPSSNLFGGFNRSIIQQYQQGQLAQHLQNQMHCYYQLIRDPQTNTFYLVCPELDYSAAVAIGQQISETIASQTHTTINYASASFPEDGVTFNKIRKEAMRRLTIMYPDVTENTHPTQFQGIAGGQIGSVNLVGDK